MEVLGLARAAFMKETAIGRAGYSNTVASRDVAVLSIYVCSATLFGLGVSLKPVGWQWLASAGIVLLFVFCCHKLLDLYKAA